MFTAGTALQPPPSPIGRPQRGFDFFACTSNASTVTVRFARPFYECVGVHLLDARVVVDSPLDTGPVFLREAVVERALYPDRASESDAVTALGCTMPLHATSPATLGLAPTLGTATPDALRRLAAAPFPLTELSIRLESARGAPVTANTAVLLLRVLER